jgi:hypothetical protein
MLDPIQYEFRFFQHTLADPEPGAGAETSIFRLQLRLRPKVSAPAGSGSGSATLHSGTVGNFPEGLQYSLWIVENALLLVHFLKRRT